MLGYSYDSNGRGIDDIEPSPDLNPDGSTLFDENSVREYLYNRTRYGFAGALDYKLAEDSDLYAHGLFSNFRDYGQKYEYDFKNSGGSAFHTSVRRPNLQIADLALGGNQVFNHSFVHYQIAVGHSRFGGAAGNPGADFSSTAGQSGLRLQPLDNSQHLSSPIHLRQPERCATDPSQYAALRH